MVSMTVLEAESPGLHYHRTTCLIVNPLLLLWIKAYAKCSNGHLQNIYKYNILNVVTLTKDIWSSCFNILKDTKIPSKFHAGHLCIPHKSNMMPGYSHGAWNVKIWFFRKLWNQTSCSMGLCLYREVKKWIRKSEIEGVMWIVKGKSFKNILKVTLFFNKCSSES